MACSCTWMANNKECGDPAHLFFRLKDMNQENPSTRAMFKVGEIGKHGGYAARCERHSFGIRNSEGWVVIEESEFIVGSVMGA